MVGQKQVKNDWKSGLLSKEMELSLSGAAELCEEGWGGKGHWREWGQG